MSGQSLKASLLLAIGYFSSQGLYFLFQIWMKYRGMHELLGEFVVLVGVFSFAFQFSEFGNYSYLLRPKISGTRDELAFVTSRAIVGFFLAAVFSYASAKSLSVRFLDPYFWIAPLVALGMALSPNYINEKKLNYISIVGLQFYVWVSLIGSLLMSSFNLVSPYILASLWIVALMFFLAFLWKAGESVPILVAVSIKDIKRFLFFVFGNLASQLWGRSAIIYVMGVAGASWIGDFSIVRSIQGVIILVLGFSIRPKMVVYFKAGEFLNHDGFKKLSKILLPVMMLAVSCMFVPFVFHEVLRNIGDAFGGRLIYKYFDFSFLFLSTPFMISMNIASQVSQHINGENRQLYIDTLALAANGCVFFAISYWLHGKTSVFPFVAGDICQSVIAIYLVYKKSQIRIR